LAFSLAILSAPNSIIFTNWLQPLVVSLIATALKFGDRTQIGAIHLSTSLVADLQLIAAAITWGAAVHITGVGMTPHVTSSVVSLSGGALFANVVSVIILIIETVMMRR
jgi:hypothetical protein